MQFMLISILAAAAVLLFIWVRARRVDVGRHEPTGHRGIIDEAAQAYEDVARPVVQSRDGQQDAHRSLIREDRRATHK